MVIKITESSGVFNRQGILPECTSNGLKYNISKIFINHCDNKIARFINSQFLEQYQLFSNKGYFITDPGLYSIPFRIDITY